MYACLCQAVSEELIKKYIRDGYTTFDDLKGALSVGIQCGSCKIRIFEIIEENTTQHNPLP